MSKVRFIVYGNGYTVERTIKMANPLNLRVVFASNEELETGLNVGDDVEWNVPDNMFIVRKRSNYPEKLWKQVGFTNVSS